MKNVLIVDDEKPFLSLLLEGLKQHPEFTVLTAENGREALQVLKGAAVDLIVTDIKMPQMDGFELLQVLNSDHPGIPVILMTAFGTRETEEWSRSMGARQYLEKPFDIDTLVNKILDELHRELKSDPTGGSGPLGTAPVTIMTVEPPEGDRRQFRHLFSSLQYTVVTAGGIQDLPAQVSQGKQDIIILPVGPGQPAAWETLGRLLSVNCLIPVILVGGERDAGDLLQALRMGVADFLTYREAAAGLRPAIEKALARRQELKRTVRSQIRISHESEIQRLQNEMTYELNRVFSLEEEYENNRYQMVKVLVNALQISDPYESGHSERVAVKAKRIAQSMNQAYLMARGLFDLKELEMAGLLHDIGKLGVPKHILNYKGALSDDEWKIVQRHALLGAEIVSKIDNLKSITPDIKHHHERWDGAGYPEGLKGEDIPLKARILALADSFDAMISPRVYRQSLGLPDAVREIRENIGKQFDPDVVSGLMLSLGMD